MIYPRKQLQIQIYPVYRNKQQRKDDKRHRNSERSNADAGMQSTSNPFGMPYPTTDDDTGDEKGA
jgi:hypothetical protein